MPPIFCLLFIVFLGVANSITQEEEIEILFTRLKEYYINEGGNYIKNFPTMNTDGSFPDLVYYDMEGKTYWKPITHVQRLQKMGKAYKLSSHERYDDPNLLADIEKGLLYWYAVDPQSINWWFTLIGEQLHLGPLFIMLRDDLSPEVLDKGMEYLNDPQMTGQNLVWISTQTILRGVCTKNVSDIELGMNAISSTVIVTEDEGIQQDFSFHQHGPQLYQSMYGQNFMTDTAFFFYYTRGLSFTFKTEKIDIFSSYILDGTQWMVFKKTFDYHCHGRGITRPNNGKAPSTTTFKRMSELETPRKDEFLRFKEHIEDDNGNITSIIGSKHFFRSDYHVHRRKNYYASIRMCSKRVVGHESGNNENLFGHYQSYGMYYLFRDSLEYWNIFPNLDWTKLPGTTASNTFPGGSHSNVRGKTDFVGGLDDGNYGIAGMEYDFNEITGKKAYFFFEDQIIALGTNISSSSGNPITTSINQCLLKSDVHGKLKNKKETKLYDFGDYSDDDFEFIEQYGIGYYFPSTKNQLKMQIAHKNGNWGEAGAKDQEQENDVFSLWIDHGTNPDNVKYEYHLVMDTNEEKMKNYQKSHKIEIIENTEKIQAVMNSELSIYSFIFYECPFKANSTQCTVSSEAKDGLKVSVDSKCMVMINLKEKTITVADPLHRKSHVIHVEIVLPESGETISKEINLPDGLNLGKGTSLVYSLEEQNLVWIVLGISTISFFFLLFSVLILVAIIGFIIYFTFFKKKKKDGSFEMETHLEG